MRRHLLVRRRPQFDSLETRELLTITGFSAAGTPLVLFPPNGRYVQVIIQGTVDVREQKVSPKVNFRVIDEYRKYEPKGPVRTELVSSSPRRFQFRFTVSIPASVASADKQGRQFYIVVGAADPNGSNGKVIPVLVPNPSMGRPPQKSARRT